MREIRSAFKERFAAPLSTPADFDLIKSRLDREMGKAQGMEEKRTKTKAALNSLLEQIRQLLRSADRFEVAESKWGELAEELKKRTRELRIDYNLNQERLADLGIDEVDYLEQAAGASYSRRREEEIIGELEQVEAAIREQQDSRRQMRESLAQMIAGHVLDGVLEDFRKLEDRQLRSTLNDPRITDLIKKFTAGRYEALALEEGGLFIENETESYALEQMSSGAREQVLLALRMGLASVVCGRQSLFLILDDAFQYSDWQRREQLVLQAVQIVQSGWQVIYLTMDDDIRDRFRAAAGSLDEGMFRLIEL
jgi:DNA repair exonuclease SbcCD ATPase subunit